MCIIYIVILSIISFTILLHLTINYSRVFLIIKITLIQFMFIDYYEMAQTYRIHCPNNCGRSYKGAYRKKNLKRHLLFECGVEPQFQCSFCLKRFRQKSYMKSHIAVTHEALL